MSNEKDVVRRAIARQLRHLRSVTASSSILWMTAAAFGPEGTTVFTLGDRELQLRFLHKYAPELDREHTGGEEPVQPLAAYTQPLFGRNWRRIRATTTGYSTRSAPLTTPACSRV